MKTEAIVLKYFRFILNIYLYIYLYNLFIIYLFIIFITHIFIYNILYYITPSMTLRFQTGKS